MLNAGADVSQPGRAERSCDGDAVDAPGGLLDVVGCNAMEQMGEGAHRRQAVDVREGLAREAHVLALMTPRAPARMLSMVLSTQSRIHRSQPTGMPTWMMPSTSGRAAS